jgi:hypothetical protein
MNNAAVTYYLFAKTTVDDVTSTKEPSSIQLDTQ